MFTGLVEEVGVLRSVRRGAHSSVLSIGAREILDGLKIGDSVAVNGVCLTATAVDSGGFTADVMHETLNRSSLSALTAGGRVNLERALPPVSHDIFAGIYRNTYQPCFFTRFMRKRII